MYQKLVYISHSAHYDTLFGSVAYEVLYGQLYSVDVVTAYIREESSTDCGLRAGSIRSKVPSSPAEAPT